MYLNQLSHQQQQQQLAQNAHHNHHHHHHHPGSSVHHQSPENVDALIQTGSSSYQHHHHHHQHHQNHPHHNLSAHTNLVHGHHVTTSTAETLDLTDHSLITSGVPTSSPNAASFDATSTPGVATFFTMTGHSTNSTGDAPSSSSSSSSAASHSRHSAIVGPYKQFEFMFDGDNGSLTVAASTEAASSSENNIIGKTSEIINQLQSTFLYHFNLLKNHNCI